MKHEKDQEIRDALLKSYCAKSVKNLTDADIKFIATCIVTAFRFDPDAYFPIRNPYSGMQVMTKGYMYTLLSFINEMELSFPNWGNVAERWKCTRGNAQSNFDRARMIVLKLDDKMYSNFVD